MFSKFAKWMSSKLGDSRAFISAFSLIVLWALVGPLFDFSMTWQLVINTCTTVVTFLMVFLLQNTQNRDTVAVHLKLDEIIRAMEGAHNQLLKIEELSDEELDLLHKRYEQLADKVKATVKKGEEDTGTPDINPNIK